MTQKNVFDNNVDKYENWFKKNNLILHSEISAIKQLIPDFEKGIEIGTGTGIFASQLDIKDGIEPSLEMCKKAEDRGINIINGTAENLPISKDTYQFALMVTVDCFLQNILQAFKEINRILSNNGYFIIAFIDRETTLGHMYNKRKAADEFYSDANFHSAKEIIALLEEAGFEITDKRQTIFTFDNEIQEVKAGVGEGVFAVIKSKKVPIV